MPARGRRVRQSLFNSRYCPGCSNFTRVSNRTGRYEPHYTYLAYGRWHSCFMSGAYWLGWFKSWEQPGANREIITPRRKHRRHERGTAYNWPRGAKG